MSLKTVLGYALLSVLLITPCLDAQQRVNIRIAGGATIRGTHHFSDKVGNRWDINSYYGTIQQGTNYVYSNANYLFVSGSNFRSSNGSGQLNKAGDEIQVGPWSTQGLTVYRRIKIFPKDGVARWLDIYQNNGSKAVTVEAMVRTQMNYGIRNTKSNTGKGSFSAKDFAFRTDAGGVNNTPTTLHVPVGPGSKYRPNVQIQGNQIQTNYHIKVPPKQTVVIAYFEGQNTNTSKLDQLMKSFPADRFLADVPDELRKAIINWPMASSGFEINLARTDSADRVMLRSNDPLFGDIRNEKFTLTTMFGTAELSADRVIGMMSKPDARGDVRLVLTDGQVLSGMLPDQTLTLHVPAAGEQKIPFTDIHDWAYRITEERPRSLPSQKAYLHLRSGDRLQFAPESLSLRLQTRAGGVEMKPEELRQVLFDLPKGGVHRVVFTNDSTLGGIVEPDVLKLETTEFGPQEIDRNLVRSIEFCNAPVPTEGLTQTSLTGGNRLFGQLAVDKFDLKCPYGTVSLSPANISSITPVPKKQGIVKVKLWNESVLTGTPEPSTLAFRIQPGPVIKVPVAQLVSLVQPQALPPDQVQKKVTKLIAQLGAESYNDRKAAQQELVRMGATIVPILKKHLKSKDPEVRQRIEQILEELGAEASADGANVNMSIVPPAAVPVQCVMIGG